ncbi:MAG TPA: lysophospholipid acyltransferase family protein [Isosphaeraceae bacterium]|nr:lysophospholipid acyltransferase family protein [Isosphaeraceae bacterium]
MKRKRNPVVDYLAYLGIRFAVCVAQALSVEQGYALARFVAWAMYTVDVRYRKSRYRNVALENLRCAFGDRFTEEEREEIVRAVYLHFSMMVTEMLHIPRKLHPTTWRHRITLVRHDEVLNRLLQGGPLIMLSGHFGNWEMAGYLFGVFGFPPCSVARTLDNPYVDRFLRSFRERTGQKLIPKSGGYEQMLEVLNTGGVLSFLADQDAGQRGMYVDFFGRPASTHKAIALLAIEHNAPVVVGYAKRIGPGFRYEVGCADLIEPAELTGTADDVRILTQRFTTGLERVIRDAPEQYLWLHRRWKHQPQPRKKPQKEGTVAALAGGTMI